MGFEKRKRKNSEVKGMKGDVKRYVDNKRRKYRYKHFAARKFSLDFNFEPFRKKNTSNFCAEAKIHSLFVQSSQFR